MARGAGPAEGGVAAASRDSLDGVGTVVEAGEDFPLCFVLMFASPRPRPGGSGDLHGDTLTLTQRPYHTAAFAWKRASFSGAGWHPRGSGAWRDVPPDSIHVRPPEGFLWDLEGRFADGGLEGTLVWRSDDLAVPPRDPVAHLLRGRGVACGEDSTPPPIRPGLP